MPHSSGGGSSGGGSHGGSGRSGGSSSPRFGSQYYHGSHRYVYYVNRQPRYYFSDKPYTLKEAKEKKKSEMIGGIFLAIFSAFFFLGGLGSIHIPEKVSADYDTAIVIEDNTDILSEAEEKDMEETFSRFLEDTGITPSFIAVSGHEWQEAADSLEIYAYRTYVDRFEDEKHWLVVFASEGDRETWSWEGMLGDECGGMITEGLEDEFTEKVQENLWASSRYTIAEAVCQAFEDIGADAQKIQYDIVDILILIVAAGAVFFGIYKTIEALRKNPGEDPMLVSSRCSVDQERPREDTCEYCGGIYVHGVHTECPHCGAPVRAENFG